MIAPLLTADKLTKYIGLVSAWTIATGLTYNYLYYSHYNINIGEYIDLSESILLFIPYAIKSFAGIITMMLFMWLLLFHRTGRGLQLATSMEINKHRYLLFNLVITILALTIAIIQYYCHNPTFIISISWLIEVLMIGRIMKYIGYLHVSKSGFIPYFQISLLFCALFFLSLLANRYFFSINKWNKSTNRKYKFELNNNTVFQSDSSHIFIGQTKSYIFIFNKMDTSTLVILRSNVRDETFYEIK